LQHILHHLAPRGTAGVVLANGRCRRSNRARQIRKAMIEGDVVDCMVALPGQLFPTRRFRLPVVPGPRQEREWPSRPARAILFIDARNLGHMVDRTSPRVLEKGHQTIADTYHRWRAKPEAGPEADWARIRTSPASAGLPR
jgi:type I restriction enzyme M protein